MRDAGAEAERPERGDEALRVLALEGGLEVGDVLLDRVVGDVGDRAGADAVLAASRLLAATGREEARADRAAGAGEPQAGRVEAGEVAAVALGDAGPLRGWSGRPGWSSQPVTRSWM